MASKNLLQAMVVQMNFEIESAYVYLGMGAYCEAQDMDGFAHWFNKQAMEEFEHAMKFKDFIFDMDGEIEYTAIPQVKTDYPSFLEVFQESLAHEKLVTKKIRELMDIAREENCHEAMEFLQWFIMEQREEENSLKPIVTALERMEGKWQGLYMLNSKLGAREE